MKKTKIIAITIAILTLLTFLTISASAEEIDYNKVIAIGTDGDYEYYSTTAVGNSATWKNFIDYYKAHDETFPFAWIGDYVLYKGELLKDGRSNVYVSSSDTITAAAGKTYYSVSFIEINDSTLVLNFPQPDVPDLSLGAIASAIISSDPDTLFGIGGYYGNYYVYYNSCVLGSFELYCEAGTEFTLMPSCTTHDMICVENNHSGHFCYETVDAIYECRKCGYKETRTLTGLLHNYQETTLKEKTCTSAGKYQLVCSDCGNTKSYTTSALGHNFTEATCTEDGKCKRCGIVNEKALGHELRFKTWGACTREGCDYNTINNSLSSAGDSIKNAWNSAGAAVTGALNSAGTTIGDWGSNVVQSVKDFFSKDDSEESSDQGSDNSQSSPNNPLWEYLIPGEDGKGILQNTGIISEEQADEAKSTFQTILAISLGLVAVVVICAVLPHIIKFFDFLKSRKKDKDGKK